MAGLIENTLIRDLGEKSNVNPSFRKNFPCLHQWSAISFHLEWLADIQNGIKLSQTPIKI